MVNKLFVYGTLAPGCPNEHILQNIGGSWEEATVTGVLHQKGWGSQMGFPGIIIDKKGSKIKGFLFSSNKISQYWHKLDEFEGTAYERILITVEIQNGMQLDAYIYTLRKITRN